MAAFYAGVPGNSPSFFSFFCNRHTIVSREGALIRFCLLVLVETVPVRTVNRQCSSGLQAVADVAAAIKAGFYDIGNCTI
jgi:hypothetical protein